MPSHDVCTATTRDGRQCRGTPLPGKPYCFAHDPELNDPARRQEAGRMKAHAARWKKQLGIGEEPLTLGDVDSMLCQALAGVLAGKLEPGTATAATTVARAITAVRSAGVIEDRLAALEAATGIAGAA